MARENVGKITILRRELLMNHIPIEGSIWSYERAFPIAMRIREYWKAVQKRIQSAAHR